MQICNKPSSPQKPAQPPPSNEIDIITNQVDAPVATGSAHFMRAGAELHLLHADLELNDVRLAAARVSSACAALTAAVAAYRESDRLAIELGFYEVFDEQLRVRHGGDFGVVEVLGEAQARGLVWLDGDMLQTIERQYAGGGDRAVFTGFIADVQAFVAELAESGDHAAAHDPVAWQQFAWMAITTFDRLRVRGQAMAIINTYTSPQQAPAGAGI